MDPRLTTLLLFLRELGVEPKIATVDDRKRVQKAVYLGQLSGIDLGYRYNWYLKGPYSPALTRDYYALAEALDSGDSSAEAYDLKPRLKETLRRMRSALNVPATVTLTQSEWYELLASLHYLRTVSGFDLNNVRETIRRQKPGLWPYIDDGLKTLEEHQPIQ